MTDTSSMMESDSTFQQLESGTDQRKQRSRQQQQPQQQSYPSHPIPRTQVFTPYNVQATADCMTKLIQPGEPMHMHPVPAGYIPYSEMPTGVYMPMWVLPNKK